MAKIPFFAGTATSRFRGDDLAREGRLARASALTLDARCILNRIFSFFVKSDNTLFSCELSNIP